MSLQGLPDFYRPIRQDGCTIYAPFEGVGSYTLRPDGLELAVLDNGQPDFALTFIRGKTPSLPPAPHGLLSFRVQANHEIEKALSIVRDHHSQARLAPGFFTGGWLRLVAIKHLEQDFPVELLRPRSLTCNGLGIARFSLKVTENGASLLAA